MTTKRNAFNAKLTSVAQQCRHAMPWLNFISADLCCILLVSAVVRGIYYSVLLNTKAVDTASYLNYNANILLGETERLRTPVYPYFIKLTGLFGRQNLVDNVVTAQIFISFLSIIPFYRTVQMAFKKRAVIIAAALLYGVMLPVINFDKVLITESLSVSFMVVVLYLLVSYLHRPAGIKAVLLGLMVLLAIMLRPAFIYLLPLVMVFWLLRLIVFKTERKTGLWGLGASFVVIALLIGYSNLNKKHFGFNGISAVSNNNQMAVILNANMYKNGNDPEISAAIENNFVQLRKPEAQRGPMVNLMVRFDGERVHRFLMNCIKNQKMVYAWYIYDTLVKLQTQNMFINYAGHKFSFLAFRIEELEGLLFHITFNLLYLFLIPTFGLIAAQWIKLKKVPWLPFMLWLLIVGQIAVAIFGGYADYQRLILAAIPGLIVLLFSYIDKISFALDAGKLKNYPGIGSK
ncbi:Dolichyl-phosphate-mannose-protein mannosyltransferase [Mucilaginibacter pineti]|uniref:Dolichyl-phosphate-mannose-protein mannosyltransferase n=1 Tax=Mucilaginibacter pineti TaxID=1391627 RepID=A0A1G7LQ97_9SPHI|nr:glycosyltransferase family 39 protein [Mucilaginibacter pineti]SDF51593.1 Dolichyl-phosphate-mannose-protein mannosyltransferase [Mucilaginibacter pineti]